MQDLVRDHVSRWVYRNGDCLYSIGLTSVQAIIYLRGLNRLTSYENDHDHLRGNKSMDQPHQYNNTP